MNDQEKNLLLETLKILRQATRTITVLKSYVEGVEHPAVMMVRTAETEIMLEFLVAKVKRAVAQ